MAIYDGKEYDKVWFTSDEHYGSDRPIGLSSRMDFREDILKEKSLRQCIDELKKRGISKYEIDIIIKHIFNTQYGANPKSSVNKMNETLIEKHNQRVCDNDLVFHVGDFGNYRYADLLAGNHILIIGNYENEDIKKNFGNNKKEFINYIIDNFNFITVMDSIHFKLDKDVKNPVFSNVTRNDISDIIVKHKPEECVYERSNGKPLISNDGRYIMNIFGHIHEKAKVKRFGINCGVDSHHYYPMSLGEIEFYLYAILHHYDENVFM